METRDASATGASGAAFGVIGLGVMGGSLAENVEEHGHRVAVWNREPELLDSFLARNRGKAFTGTRTFAEFVNALERPRRILMMIPAGKPVDETIAALKPLLARGDVLVDGGNSWFEDTRRREQELRRDGIHFVGMGVSGGQEGARHGPSLMPGGPMEGWHVLRPVLTAIAATTDAGPCVTHVGGDGAGHFVKMIHNGIEYGDMQLIAEVYDVMRRALNVPARAMADTFAKWNEGALRSYLIEITAQILTVPESNTRQPLVDFVLDQAEQKGTGRWTVSVALEQGVAVPTIAAAVDARVLSSMKDERVALAQKIRGPTRKVAADLDRWQQPLHDALLMSRICAYAQGIALIQTASEHFRWHVEIKEMARIWRGGCIIRSALLDVIRAAYDVRKPPRGLLFAREVQKTVRVAQRGLRKVLALAQSVGIPTPAMSASLAWFDSLRTESLPQNLTQAQRDAFGAHTYRRKDRPEAGPIHTDWLAPRAN